LVNEAWSTKQVQKSKLISLSIFLIDGADECEKGVMSPKILPQNISECLFWKDIWMKRVICGIFDSANRFYTTSLLPSEPSKKNSQAGHWEKGWLF